MPRPATCSLKRLGHEHKQPSHKLVSIAGPSQRGSSRGWRQGNIAALAFEPEMVKAEDSRGLDPQIRFRPLSASLNRVADDPNCRFITGLAGAGFRRDQP